MDSARWLFFGPFRFDRQSGFLWRGEEQIPLRMRTYSLLQYLAEHPGEVISVPELQQHAWQGDHVSPNVFRVSIHELRHALQDDPDAPQYIETIRGRGYRFCAPVTTSGGFQFQESQAIIGRAHELSQLRSRLLLAQQGQRQIVFVSGEAGMGKTTLIEAFLASLFDNPESPIGRGYCIEHHGPAEAYLPVLQALSHLGRGPLRDALVQALQQDAPTWLRQLPRLMPESEREQASHDIPASTRLRMIRELVDALEVLSEDRLVVLVLEDLHWSDPSTIDLLDAVMRRFGPARLLMLCTYRPLEVQVREHPLFGLLQEWQGHGRGLDIRLSPWTTDAIQAFLGFQLSGTIDDSLTNMLYERSNGNPLFLSRLFDYLIQHELLIDINGQWQLFDEEVTDRALPDGVRQLLSKQIDQLPEMVQEVLKAASAAGMQFVTAMVAAGAEAETGLVDEALSWAASRSYFLQAQATETWPDGTISGRYRFGHALYRQVLYEQLSAERRVKLHRQIGERLERAYLDDLDTVSGLLAYHFAQGQDVPRALSYLHRASLKALSRFAANEAIVLLNTALELLPALPPDHDRKQTEYDLWTTLGAAIISGRGARVPEAEAAYQNAYRLGKAIGDIDQFFPNVVGLELMASAKADYTQSQHLGGQLFNYAQMSQNPLHLAYAYRALSINQVMQGRYLAAYDYAEACRRLIVPSNRLHSHPSYTVDPILTCQAWRAIVLMELGYPAQAIAQSRDNLTRARQLGDPYHITQGLVSVANISRFCQRPAEAYEAAQELVTYAVQQEQSFWEQFGTVFLTRAMAQLGHAAEVLAQLEPAMAMYRNIGLRQGRTTVLNMAAEVYYYAGRIDAGLACLQEVETFIEDTGERISEPGLNWLRGRLLQGQGHNGQAEACFVRALTLARQQRARGIELRVAILLSRLWQDQGMHQQAWHLLLPIYNRFTEGFNTAELQEAKSLLDALAP